jgi:hypothetical protein
MRVDDEGGAEAMKEADGTELGASRRSWAGAPERRANRANGPSYSLASTTCCRCCVPPAAAR